MTSSSSGAISMQRDLRDTPLFQEAASLYARMRQPGSGQISDASDVHVAPSGDCVVFAGTLVDALTGAMPTRICLTNMDSGDTRVLSSGPNVDRLPKFSPDGREIAFLSDRHRSDDFQFYRLDPATGVTRAAPFVDGWVEYFHWSPDGKRVLLGVAGHGADIAGAQGAVTSKRAVQDTPSWMPAVDADDENFRWRRAWIYDVAADEVRQVGPLHWNLWEVVWCGDAALAAVVSPGPLEGSWYRACLHFIDVQSGASRELLAPRDQLGWPAVAPSGRHLSIIEALCSDRGLVAGEVKIIDLPSGESRRIDTHGVDVTYTEWRSDQKMLLAGHRGFETVVGVYDISSGAFSELWVSRETTAAGNYISVSGVGETGDCTFVAESFLRAPELAIIRGGEYRTVRSFDVGNAAAAEAVGAVECIDWQAPDGLDIQGWLLRPKAPPPYPVVMCIHGGPVWHWRPMWFGRVRMPFVPLLLARGYAVFFPNARGSSGRGPEFARHVLGDMAGADTYDYLSGLDHLVAQGIADPKRLGVTGGSYGGYMTTWLVTQDPRFAAAVATAPVTNRVSAQLLSNIPQFTTMFLDDEYNNPGGKYFQRSPVMHAHRVRTPALNICGALDRCTPPQEAMQFHNALLQYGARSVLATYPEEGHGIRKAPAIFDYIARVVGWFEEYMPQHTARR